MRPLLNSLLGYFLTPGGLLLLGVLDGTVMFFLPLGIDFVVIILAARQPDLFWMYALLATAGSLAGAGFTFWIGRKFGEHALHRLIKPSTLARAHERVSRRGAISVAALGIIPPPFPFTAFVLTSGACLLSPWVFMATLAGVRLLRFMLEAGLGAYYGTGIVSWMESTTFTVVVTVLAILAVAGTIVSIFTVVRSARRRKSGVPGDKAAA